MHPYLSADIAAAHVADLVREAAATLLPPWPPGTRSSTGSARRRSGRPPRCTAPPARTTPSCCPA